MSLVSIILERLRGAEAPDQPTGVGLREDGSSVLISDLALADGRYPPAAVVSAATRINAAIADAIRGWDPGEDTPPGWRMAADGRLIREAQVSESDRLRDEVGGGLAIEGWLIHHILASYKGRALEGLADLVATSAREYGVEMGGEKGNLSVTTYDGTWRVQRVYRDVISFTQEILAAKELIDSCIKRWAEGANPHISTLIDRAFRADKKGDLRTGPVLELLRVRIDDEEWQRAMDALTDSIQVSGSAVYVRVYQRDSGDAYRPIPLDLAAV